MNSHRVTFTTIVNVYVEEIRVATDEDARRYARGIVDSGGWIGDVYVPPGQIQSAQVEKL